VGWFVLILFLSIMGMFLIKTNTDKVKTTQEKEEAMHEAIKNVKEVANEKQQVAIEESIKAVKESARKEKEVAIEAAVKAAKEVANEKQQVAIEESIKAVKESARKEKEVAIEAAVKAVREEMLTNANDSTSTTTLNVEACRDMFKAQPNSGSVGELDLQETLQMCKQSQFLNACDDLKKFTGLTDDEFYQRLTRKGRFHFEGEHLFWNPSSVTELAWFYATSIDYLFSNAIHGVHEAPMKEVALKQYEPVLEYSSGIGNNVLYLAKKGIKVQYFGIGMAEYAFAQYRVWKYSLEDMVEFKKPFSAKTGYTFDPIHGPLPLDSSLGSIVAFDVLEHIPKYHVVVEAMVKSIRVGGIIVENSPFAPDEVEDEKEDLRVHVSNGGITMTEAMGPKMRMLRNIHGYSVWEKISE